MKHICNIFMILFFVSSCTKPTTTNIDFIIEQDDLKSFVKLSSKIDIDTLRFQHRSTVLHQALRFNAEKISNHLIEKNHLLNILDSLNFTPLLAAMESNNNTSIFINSLLDKTANINTIENYNGYSALHYAVHYNDIALVKKILDKKANPNIKSTSVMKSTPLHLAIDKGYTNIAQLLIDNNASDTIKDINENMVVDIAIESGNTEIMKLFYDKMTKQNKEELFINTIRSSNDTIFLNKLLEEKWMSKKLINHAFIFSKDTVTSQSLLKRGAKINYKDPDYDYGAIHYAAIRGDVIMLDYLIKQGADVNQLSKKSQLTPLMHAAQLYENFNSLNREIGGMQVSINEFFYDQFGMSKEKNKENSLEAVKFLVANKAILHFKNKDDENALYYAESTHNNDVVTYLKELGIKETKKYSEGKSDIINRILRN
ncbi:ankyrin repeat domain-containing protein [Aquimarina sp. I32.4]|uniref:ankyrin repeat domain-containing protein n=1 Tax=Aquimarina sp. I32.4 TaxID=2053903 RepID=UPI000CDE6D13|nr:ankyrin repeat domain-containing protein [Aquimarina sp. I32.4]